MPSISQVRRNTWKQRSIELGGSVGFLNTHCYAKALQLSQRCEWVQKAVLCGRILSQEEGLDVFSFSTDFEHPRRAWYEKQERQQNSFVFLFPFLSFEMTVFFALQFVFRCIQAVHVIRCCYFFSSFFSDFLIDCIGCVFQYLNLDKLNSICRVVSLTMIMK